MSNTLKLQLQKTNHKKHTFKLSKYKSIWFFQNQNSINVKKRTEGLYTIYESSVSLCLAGSWDLFLLCFSVINRFFCSEQVYLHKHFLKIRGFSLSVYFQLMKKARIVALFVTAEEQKQQGAG